MKKNSTRHSEVEKTAIAINSKHGNALVGLFYVGDMQKQFTVFIKGPVTNAKIMGLMNGLSSNMQVLLGQHRWKEGKAT